jgi:hypothetical protein
MSAVARSVSLFRSIHWTRSLGLLGVTGAILLTTACADNDDRPAYYEVVHPFTASNGAEVTDELRGQVSASLAEDALQYTGETVKNSHGEYRQLELAPGSPLAQSYDDIDGGIPEGWSREDADTATRIASEFLIQSIIESPVNGDGTQLDQWIDDHTDRFDPEMPTLNVLIKDLIGTDLIVNNEELHVSLSTILRNQTNEDRGEYSYVYDEDISRLVDFDVVISDARRHPIIVWGEDRDPDEETVESLVVEYEGEYTMLTRDDQKLYMEPTSLLAQVVVSKRDGEFYLYDGDVHASVDGPVDLTVPDPVEEPLDQESPLVKRWYMW